MITTNLPAYQLNVLRNKRTSNEKCNKNSFIAFFVCFIAFFCARFNFNRSLQSKINKKRQRMLFSTLVVETGLKAYTINLAKCYILSLVMCRGEQSATSATCAIAKVALRFHTFLKALRFSALR